MVHYHLPALAIQDTGPKGRGVVATEPIDAGTVVIAYGGRVIDAAAFAEMSVDERTHSLQIAEELFLLVPEAPELPDYVNHSCDPNCGLMGATMLVALRPIEAGEEISFDYAMTDADPYDEFDCSCREPACRGRVTGNDWMLAELWDRYDGFFSPFIQNRIDNLRDVMDESLDPSGLLR